MDNLGHCLFLYSLFLKNVVFLKPFSFTLLFFSFLFLFRLNLFLHVYELLLAVIELILQERKFLR